MVAGAVVRLQNLPWSASAPDVRHFFRGFDIPNGGVRIIGGDNGDCFVSFMSETDARDALRKDRSYLNDQPIRLYASSGEEMNHIIAIAKGESPSKPAPVYQREPSPRPNYSRKRSGSPIVNEQPSTKYNDRRENAGQIYYADRTQNTTDRPLDRYGKYSGAYDKQRDNSDQQWSAPPNTTKNLEHSQDYGYDRKEPVPSYVDYDSEQRNMRSKPAAKPDLTYFQNSYKHDATNAYGQTNVDQRYNNSRDQQSINVPDSYDARSQQGPPIVPNTDGFHKNNKQFVNERVEIPRAAPGPACPQDRPFYQHSEPDGGSWKASPNDFRMHGTTAVAPNNRVVSGLPVSQQRSDVQGSQYNPVSSFSGSPILAGDRSIRQQHLPPDNRPENLRFDTDNRKGRQDLTNSQNGLPNFLQRPPPIASERSILPRPPARDLEDNSWGDRLPIHGGSMYGKGLHNTNTTDFVDRERRPPSMDSRFDIRNQQAPNRSFGSPNDSNRFQNQPVQINQSNNNRDMLNRDILPNSQRLFSDQEIQRDRAPMIQFASDEDQRKLPNRGLRQTNNQVNLQAQSKNGNSGGSVGHFGSPGNLMDSDLRNAPKNVGPPAKSFRSPALLPTPDVKPTVLSLLDMEVGTPSSGNNLGPPDSPKTRILSRPPVPQSLRPAMNQMPPNLQQMNPGMRQMRPRLPNAVDARSGFSGLRSKLSFDPHTPLSMPPTNNSSSQLFTPNMGAGRVQPNLQNRLPFKDSSKGMLDAPSSSVLMPTPQTNAPALLSSSDSTASDQPAAPIVPVSDPCVHFSNLPGNVQFKQLRGLFATHNLIAKDIALNWPDDGDNVTPADAVVLFENIDTTVLALNELAGMKICGKYIVMQPCPMSKYIKYQGRRETSTGRKPSFAPTERNTTSDHPSQERDRNTVNDRLRTRRRSISPQRNRGISPRRHRSPHRPRRRSPSTRLSPSSIYQNTYDNEDNRPPRDVGSRTSRDVGSRTSRDVGSRPPRDTGNRPPRDGDSRSSRAAGGRAADGRPSRDDDNRPRAVSGRISRDDDNRPPRASGNRLSREDDNRPPRTTGGRPPRDDDIRPPRTTGSRSSGGNDDRPPIAADMDRANSHGELMILEKGNRPALKMNDKLKNEISRVTYTCGIVLTGLPPNATKVDVEQFLGDAAYDPKSLYLEFNVHKECTGTAYVEVASEQVQKMLMNSTRDVLKQSVHVSPVSKEQLRKSVGEHSRSLAADKTKPGEFILQVLGLPLDATPKTVTEFFYPTKVKESEVTIVASKDGSGKCGGSGFAKIHSLEDRDEALKHDRGYIGKRYVTVRVVSEQAMTDFIAKNGPKQEVENNRTLVGGDPDMERTIRMVNLRYEIKSEQIESFFKDFNPERGSVNFTMMNGMPTGKGTIRMKTSADAMKAVDRLNKLDLAGRPLLLSINLN